MSVDLVYLLQLYIIDCNTIIDYIIQKHDVQGA